MSTAAGLHVHTYLGDYNNYSHLPFLAIPFYSDNHSHIALYISELDLIPIHFPPLEHQLCEFLHIFCLIKLEDTVSLQFSQGEDLFFFYNFTNLWVWRCRILFPFLLSPFFSIVPSCFSSFLAHLEYMICCFNYPLRRKISFFSSYSTSKLQTQMSSDISTLITSIAKDWWRTGQHSAALFQLNYCSWNFFTSIF